MRITPDIDLLEIQKYKQPLEYWPRAETSKNNESLRTFLLKATTSPWPLHARVDQVYLALGCFDIPSEKMSGIKLETLGFR